MPVTVAPVRVFAEVDSLTAANVEHASPRLPKIESFGHGRCVGATTA